MLSATTLRKASVRQRHHAKFPADWSNHCRDSTIFGFYRMAAVAILDFKNFKFVTFGMVKSVELRHYVKFRGDRPDRCLDMAILWFF